MRVDKPGYDPLDFRALLEHERGDGALVAPPPRPQRLRGVCAPPGADDLVCCMTGRRMEDVNGLG